MWRAPSSRSRSSSVRDDDGECTPGNGAIPTNAPQRPEVWLDGYPLAEKGVGAWCGQAGRSRGIEE